MSRSAEEKIRKLKDSTSRQYLWNPSLLSDSQGTLLGCPVYTTPNLDAVGTSKECIIFGDFKYYQIIDRMRIKILRDPYTAKPFMRFYTTKKLVVMQLNQRHSKYSKLLHIQLLNEK